MCRDKILATLRSMGSEMPLGTLRMLQWAQRSGIDIRILSDCNTLFIGHILTGALAPKALASACCRSGHWHAFGHANLANTLLHNADCLVLLLCIQDVHPGGFQSSKVEVSFINK